MHEILSLAEFSIMMKDRKNYDVSKLPCFLRKILSPRFFFPLFRDSRNKPYTNPNFIMSSLFHQLFCFLLKTYAFPYKFYCPLTASFSHEFLPKELELSQPLLVANKADTHKKVPFPLHYVSCCHLKSKTIKNLSSSWFSLQIFSLRELRAIKAKYITAFFFRQIVSQLFAARVKSDECWLPTLNSQIQLSISSAAQQSKENIVSFNSVHFCQHSLSSWVEEKLYDWFLSFCIVPKYMFFQKVVQTYAAQRL